MIGCHTQVIPSAQWKIYTQIYPKITICSWIESLPQKGQYFGLFTVEIAINWKMILQLLQKNVSDFMINKTLPLDNSLSKITYYYNSYQMPTSKQLAIESQIIQF